MAALLAFWSCVCEEAIGIRGLGQAFIEVKGMTLAVIDTDIDMTATVTLRRQ